MQFRYNRLLHSFGSSISRNRMRSSSRNLGSSPNAASDSINEETTLLRKLNDLSFENTEVAFKSKSNWHLWRALMVWKLCSYPSVVEKNMELMSLGQRVLGETLFEKLMRATVYGHFVAGADEKDAKPVVERLKAFGVGSILHYSVEGDISNQLTIDVNDPDHNHPKDEHCNCNAENFRQCIDSVRNYTGGTGFSVVKVSALGRPQLLLRLSDVVVKNRKFFEVLLDTKWENLIGTKLSEQQFWARVDASGSPKSLMGDHHRTQVAKLFHQCDWDGDGLVDVCQLSSCLLESQFQLNKVKGDMRDDHIGAMLEGLTDTEQKEFGKLVERLHYVASYAEQNNVRLLIDAEQSYLQPAIGQLAVELMRKYNKKKPVIFSTYQAYLKNAWTTISADLHASRREDFYFAAKLVRGAYMVQERKRAQEMDYEDPINPNIESTSSMYHKVFEGILEEAKQRPLGKVTVMCATHNEESVRRVLEVLAHQHPSHELAQQTVYFGQLYGMCDQVSFSLGQAGLPIYKYVPYGPVRAVMPYLSRRLQENGGGFLGKSDRERELIWRELKRRYKKLKLVHNPMSYAN